MSGVVVAYIIMHHKRLNSIVMITENDQQQKVIDEGDT